jgi:NAD(P)-dependent dehydrogenase (short-subunit alcohol dehydrogenase family)
MLLAAKHRRATAKSFAGAENDPCPPHRRIGRMSATRPICARLGYGPGLGAARAARFTAGGLRVVGLARDPARHGAAGIEMRAADAADPASLAAALEGRVDVLIHNA